MSAAPHVASPLSSEIDLTRYRLNALPDESSDEDWDDDRELFGPDGRPAPVAPVR